MGWIYLFCIFRVWLCTYKYSNSFLEKLIFLPLHYVLAFKREYGLKVNWISFHLDFYPVLVSFFTFYSEKNLIQKSNMKF